LANRPATLPPQRARKKGGAGVAACRCGPLSTKRS
jgi:hypothetical protein